MSNTEYKPFKRGIVIKKRIKPKTLISLFLGFVSYFGFDYLKSELSYMNFMIFLICGYYILSVLIRFICEIKATYQINPKVSSENKKISIRLDKMELSNFNHKNCFICLESYINNKKVWSQKEQTYNISFIPSQITEMKADIRFWILKIEIPYKILNKEVKLYLRYKIII
ncbi:MAG: hypothetical protein BWY78_01111 [Alphaproteobacteria bacterium ADurb.Bin438]|nr:MAG: hypothetical protein BWY78_01111 [Alphaproteobacteria bacterium ADurb.Bin438]